MSRNYLINSAKLAGVALAALCTVSAAQAGGLTSLLGGVVKTTTTTTTPVLGTVTTTIATTTTPVLGSVTTVAPVTTPVVTALSPTIVTVQSTPGGLTNTVNATGSIVTNLGTTTTLDRIFVKPKSVSIIAEGGKIRSFSGKIRSFSGKIRSFSGEDTSPFWGDTRSFWGGAGPVTGDISQFWGTLHTFNDGSKTGATAPLWSSIGTFWNSTGPQWDAVRTSWDAAKSSADFAAVATQFNAVIASSASFWSGAVKAQTGQDFYTGFANTLFQRYGIDPSNPDSLAKLDPSLRDYFFLEWYDGLMQYSGADHADYWMKQVGWTPKLTQTLGQGKDSVIGLLDFTVNDALAGDHIKTYKGTSDFDDGHGSAVASLMVAPHDGQGVMGIAPMASVVAYNPFDATETAGWADIKAGIIALGQHNASIINMSLGVSGWTLNPDWNGVFTDPALTLMTANSVFVIAAGNDGISQTTNINWSNSANFIVVGSVDPESNISDFSNRPGTACLLTNGKCADQLMNHFITAPGELLLVSDGHGGVTRMSGTSFAAPLVSGTIALIHDRWPWLAKYPAETVQIILKSATDLGAPGVDPVYGVGMLNVTAALSPLNYDNLTWYSMDDSGHAKPMSSGMVKTQGATNAARWESQGMYFYAFETIGGTYRDFAIPLSSKLVDQTVLSAGGSQEQFQAYLYNQATAWMKRGFSARGQSSLNFASVDAAVANPYGLHITMSLAPRTLKRQLRSGEMPYQTALAIADEDGRFGFQMGQGDGAVELGNNLGFGRAADYDPATGGANPVLGFASGGAFAQAHYAFNEKLSVSAGFTQQDTRYRRDNMSIFDLGTYSRLRGYDTGAGAITLSYHPTKRFELTGSYTRLHEANAVLGVQALDPSLLGKGSSTDGLTMGFAYDAMPTLRLAGSATVGRTVSSSANALISTGGRGFLSTAYQVSLTKQHLFGRSDGLRLSLAQPLHVEDGKLEITSVKVIDRDTGELGPFRQSFSLGHSKRPLVGEFRYSRDLLGGAADLALFGKAQLAGDPQQYQAARLLAGARFTVRY